MNAAEEGKGGPGPITGEGQGEAMVTLKLRDAFGKPYMVEALPRKRIEEIIESLDTEEIVKVAYAHMCPNVARGVAQIDITTGERIGATFTGNSGDIRGAHYVTLYEVDANLDIPTSDLFDEEEYDSVVEKYGHLDCVDDIAEKLGVDLSERETDALAYYLEEERTSGEWWNQIAEQLGEIYGQADVIAEVEE